MPVSHLYVFFGEMSAYFLIGLFVFMILSCMSYLYILNIDSLSVILFANIFSHSEGFLFILSRVSFAVQKLLSLVRSHSFIFAFIYFALEIGRASCRERV